VSFLIFSFYICAVQHSFAAFMVKINLSDINVPELIPDIWSPLNEEQREFLANHFTLQNYKKNEIIHCEGETPTCLMCLLNGKVKIYKDGVGGRSQIIRMIKPTEYFGSNAIRTLSQFAAERLITIDGRKIKIIDEEKLKKISKIG